MRSLKKRNPAAVATLAGFDVNQICGNLMNNTIAEKPPLRQADGIDIHAPYLVARTFRELQRRRLPLDVSSLQELQFVHNDGKKWRPTAPPYLVRVAISEDARRGK